MTTVTDFQDAIDLVDDTKILTWVIDAGYEGYEYSFDGLEVTGGSEAAQNMGAAHLLDAMGFRFYTPNPDYWKLPVSINDALTQAKTSYWIHYNAIFLVYGHSWAGVNNASRDFLNDRMQAWEYLVGMGDNVYPAGHRWKNIITSAEGVTFFADNPNMIRQQNGGQDTFNLDGIHGTQEWDDLAEFCAAYLLKEGLNDFNRTNIDPVDGDDNISDHVYPFSLDVVTRMRAGTGAIGPIAAQTAVPDAEIGLYAYAGHRLPPSASYAPGVYTQVALAFNSTEFTYEELIEEHGSKADGIAIREYLDTQVWSHGYPAGNLRARDGYFSRYDHHQAAGAVSTNSEFAANWLNNIVQARCAIYKWRDGVEDWATTIDEIVDDLWGGEQALKDLYNFISDPSTSNNKYTLRQCFDYVDSLPSSAIKAHWQEYLTIYWQRYRVDRLATFGIVRNPGEPDDTYEEEISKVLKWVVGVRDDDIIHSYAFIRQEANAQLNDYPHLKFSAQPAPDWFENGTRPTEAEFDAAYVDIQPYTARPDYVDDIDDLVMVKVPDTVTSTPRRDKNDRFTTQSVANNFVAVGPTTVTIKYNDGTETVTSYPAGMTKFAADKANSTLIFDGGWVFLDHFPQARTENVLHPLGTRNHWMWVPSSEAGAVRFTNGARTSFWDEESTRKDWTSSAAFPDLGPGLVCLDNVNTRGTAINDGLNRYVSPDVDYQLMPSTLAAAEGYGSRVRVL